MTARITTRTTEDGITILDLVGMVMVGESAMTLRDLAAAAVEASDRPTIILNMQECKYIDSTGFGELVVIASNINDKKVGLYGLNKRCKELLDITKLTPLFLIAKDEADALAKMRAEIARNGLVPAATRSTAQTLAL